MGHVPAYGLPAIGTIAQTEAAGAIVWAIVLIVAAIIGGFVILAVRKRILSPERTDMESEGLFDSLRRMRDSGEISRQEYDSARKRIIERTLDARSSDASERGSAGGSTETRSLAKPYRASTDSRQDAQGERDAPPISAPPGYDLTGDPLPDSSRETGSG
ncbi:MAG: SHOCT domain-containing protein [Phycisphaeraceae bacterium]|nr:SHOCT domain-containing protein [Phycisphaeraceae bacterium]QYK49731.1 MAG: SHOCT domain-containing protein [Phycisphaeraceae bacterium]